jgi:GH25 family lysozyme M1 (1,4-beta-N-acetylmuramidase)
MGYNINMIRLPGCDISYWNGYVDFAKMRRAGMQFVGIRASWGGNVDTRFHEYWAGAKAAGLIRFAYHYLDWRWPETTQAQLFSALLANDPGEWVPHCDFEMEPTPYSVRAYGDMEDMMPYSRQTIGSTVRPMRYLLPRLSNLQTQAKLLNFQQIVENSTKRIPGIYSGFWFWSQWGNTKESIWSRYPLWLAWWAKESSVKTPLPWSKWTRWQYASNGPGPTYGTTSLDLDMDVADITEPVPTPTPDDHQHVCQICGATWPTAPVDNVYKVNATLLNVRKGPGVGYDVVNTIPKNTIVTVYEINNAGDWARHDRGGWSYLSYLTKI